MSRDVNPPAFANVVPFSRPNADPEKNAVFAAVVLAAHLRSLRLASGMKQNEAAKAISISGAKLSRLERAEITPHPRDVEDLAKLYELSPRNTAELIRLAQMARERTWWKRANISVPTSLSQLVGLECAATELSTFELSLLPGLLQTPDYARALMVGSQLGLGEDEIEERLRLRKARQELALDRDPQALFLLDESILHRGVGSPSGMTKQIDHLTRLSAVEGIEIRIVPFSSNPAIAANITSFTTLGFAPSAACPTSRTSRRIGRGGTT